MSGAAGLFSLIFDCFRLFETTPSCVVHAAPSPLSLGDCPDPQEDPTLAHQHFQPKQGKAKKARSTLDKCWAMPNVLVEFMCHLPKTAMALPIKPLRWVTRQANPHMAHMKQSTSYLVAKFSVVPKASPPPPPPSFPPHLPLFVASVNAGVVVRHYRCRLVDIFVCHASFLRTNGKSRYPQFPS